MKETITITYSNSTSYIPFENHIDALKQENLISCPPRIDMFPTSISSEYMMMIDCIIDTRPG